MFNLFKKSKPEKPQVPQCMGLSIGHSFEIDSLFLKIIQPELMIESASPTQIIQSVGLVELNGTQIYRFYTDDEAFLQIVAQGGTEAQHVLDMKLFHYFDTQDISSEQDWNNLLIFQIGVPEYQLNDTFYGRVWESSSEYHQPVSMTEKTTGQDGESTETDQFTMLFERPLSDGTTESLFLSAEEFINNGNLERCFVRSTGITLTPSQITLHG